MGDPGGNLFATNIGTTGAGIGDSEGFGGKNSANVGGVNTFLGGEGSGEGIVDLKSSTEGSPINPADLQNKIQALGLDFINATNPIRESLIQDSTQFLEGDRDVTGTAQFQATKAAAQQQFGNAEQNIFENTASGGQLTEALAGNQIGQANVLTEAAGILSDAELARATQIGAGGIELGTSVLGQLQQTQATARQSERNQVVQGKKGSGGTAGALSGLGGALA